MGGPGGDEAAFERVLDAFRARFHVDALRLDGTPLGQRYSRVRVDLDGEGGHRVVLLASVTGVVGEGASSGDLPVGTVTIEHLLRSPHPFLAASREPLARNSHLRRLHAALSSVPYLARMRAADLLRGSSEEWGAPDLLSPDPVRLAASDRVVLLRADGPVAVATAVAEDLAAGVPIEWAARRALDPAGSR